MQGKFLTLSALLGFTNKTTLWSPFVASYRVLKLFHKNVNHSQATCKKQSITSCTRILKLIWGQTCIQFCKCYGNAREAVMVYFVGLKTPAASSKLLKSPEKCGCYWKATILLDCCWRPWRKEMYNSLYRHQTPVFHARQKLQWSMRYIECPMIVT